MNDLITKFYIKSSNGIGIFLKKEAGVTPIEYAIVAAGLSAVVLVIFQRDAASGTLLNDVFTNIKTKLALM